MSAEMDELRNEVREDKDLALQLHGQIRKKLAEPVYSLQQDITGSPRGAQAFHRYQNEQYVAVQGVNRDSFFARIDVTRTHRRGAPEKATMLVTKARVSPMVFGDDWDVLSWTSPITASLLDKPIGHTFDFETARSPAVRYKVGPSATFERVLPNIVRAKYLLRSGEVFLEDESLLENDSFRPEKQRPQRGYEAQGTFGLGEIIVLADEPQRAAMHLPFGQNVLIEGPPGSGKTSIGIMRVPCLIDRQWEEMGLDPKQSDPFHQVQSMRVLVLNDEMVGYLDSLVRSLGVTGLPVQTLKEFMRDICRSARTLSGTERKEPSLSAHLKSHPLALAAYWAGFRRNVAGVISSAGMNTSSGLASLGLAGADLLDELGRWSGRLQEIEPVRGIIPDGANLALHIDEWINRAAGMGGRGVQASRRAGASEQSLLSDLRNAVQSLWQKLFDRSSIAMQMFKTPEYGSLLKACEDEGMTAAQVDKGDKAWRENCIGGTREFSEYDASLAAWLGVNMALVPVGGRPSQIAKTAPRLTHVMIDEAQDAWHSHIRTIERLLVPNGTMTLVGDLRQRLKDTRGLPSWRSLEVKDLRPAAFKTNYRQSAELGAFIAALHEQLFDESPIWAPNDDRKGPLPRIRKCDTVRMSQAAAAEASHWRNVVPDATVGILYDGRWTSERIKIFHSEVEIAMQDSLTTVHLVRPASGSDFLRRTNCVIIASTLMTKGLEFDAVVFVEPTDFWNQDLKDIPERRRNGLYVAASRARQCLSLVMPGVPECFGAMSRAGKCELHLD